MSGEDIANIIVSFGLVGWIPIYFLFGGIAKVVCAIKGDNKMKHITNDSHKENNNGEQNGINLSSGENEKGE